MLNNSFSQSKEEVIEKYMNVVGGKEKWKALQSVVISMINQSKEESVIKIASIHDGQVYDRWISFSKGGDTSTTCFNGRNYWRQVKGQAPESFDFYVPVYAKYVRLGEPTYILNADSIALEGTVKFIAGNKNVDCYSIALYRDGNRYYHYINTRTYYLEGYSRGDPGDPVTSLNDYRKVDGFLVPFEEVIYRGNTIESKFVLNSIYLNKIIPNQVYEYPKSSSIIISKSLLFNLTQKYK
ncbi:MAG: hypothetical protein KF775_14705 [Cyclobacteriaceae bacterium]|nr:hypothetical protein [Cyclobacteriaceae bacterium]